MKKLFYLILLLSLPSFSNAQKLEIHASYVGPSAIQLKVFHEVAPTFKLGLGVEDYYGNNYQLLLLYAELNRDFQVSKHFDLIGGILLGAAIGENSRNDSKIGSYSSGLFGFDIDVLYNINRVLGVKAGLGAKYMYDDLFFPPNVGVVIHIF